MISLICKVSPEALNSSATLSSVFLLNEKYLAFVIDFVNIEFIEYNKKNNRVYE
jgi:hypothetical protein